MGNWELGIGRRGIQSAALAQDKLRETQDFRRDTEGLSAMVNKKGARATLLFGYVR